MPLFSELFIRVGVGGGGVNLLPRVDVFSMELFKVLHVRFQLLL